MSEEQPMPDQEPIPGPPTQPSSAPTNRIIVAIAVALVAVVGAIVPILMGDGGDDSLRSSQPVQEGLEAVRSNTQVTAALGNRIRVGDPIVGSLTEKGSTADVDLTVPLLGSEGDGTLYIIGTRSGSTWSYSTLAVEVPGHANLIRLERP